MVKSGGNRERLPRRSTEREEQAMSQQSRLEVVVTDVRMPFGSMVSFMVKWSLASIPALLILMIVGGVVWGILMGMV
jgi:hypothetical protein